MEAGTRRIDDLFSVKAEELSLFCKMHARALPLEWATSAGC
jgi:hypothetical protein